MMFEITKEDAVSLCQGLGFATADGWKKVRLVEKLNDFIGTYDESEIQVGEEIVADATERERLNGLLLDLVASERDFDIVRKPAAEKVREDEAEADVAVEVDTMVEEAPDEKPVTVPKKKSKRKPKAKDGGKKPSKSTSTKQRGVPGPDVGDPKGVRSIRNRLFCAGVLLREAGLEAGLTDDLVSQLDDAIGKPNPKASKSQLGFAWHVINGYLNG